MSPDSRIARGRLLMVTTVVGTAAAYLRPYADRMRARGWQVKLATSNPSYRRAIGLHFDEVIEMPWSRKISSLRANIQGWRRMRTLLKSGNFDVVHTNTPISSFLVRLAAIGLQRRRRPTIIYTAHGFHFHRNGRALTNLVYMLMEKIAGYWMDYLVVINDEDEAAAKRLNLAANGRVIKLPGIGFCLEKYQRFRLGVDRQAFRRRVGIPADAPVVAMVAEFSRGKRHFDLLRAVADPAFKEWHLVLAGEGALQGEMRDLAVSLGIEERCHFLGFCDNVAEVLVGSDISALPSDREGLPLAVMESMAAGTPVVGADSRGITDLLKDECGLLFAVGDIKGLRAALLNIHEDAALRDRLVKNAGNRVKQYDLAPLLKAYEALYEAALSK